MSPASTGLVGFIGWNTMHKTIEVATRRVVEACALMFSDSAAEAMRPAIVDHLERLYLQGQKDEERLAVAVLSGLYVARSRT